MNHCRFEKTHFNNGNQDNYDGNEIEMQENQFSEIQFSEIQLKHNIELQMQRNMYALPRLFILDEPC